MPSRNFPSPCGSSICGAKYRSPGNRGKFLQLSLSSQAGFAAKAATISRGREPPSRPATRSITPVMACVVRGFLEGVRKQGPKLAPHDPPVRTAPGMVHPGRERASVGQLEGHPGGNLLGIGPRLDLRIRDAAHPAGEGTHLGRGQGRLVVLPAQSRLGTSQAAEGQGHGQTERHAQLRALEIRRIGLGEPSLDHPGDAHLHIDDLFGRQAMLGAQIKPCVGGGLQPPCTGVDLGADFHQPVLSPQTAGDLGRIGFVGKGPKETRLSLQDVPGPPDALPREQRGYRA